jgi:hypothetical protein
MKIILHGKATLGEIKKKMDGFLFGLVNKFQQMAYLILILISPIVLLQFS